MLHTLSFLIYFSNFPVFKKIWEHLTIFPKTSHFASRTTTAVLIRVFILPLSVENMGKWGHGGPICNHSECISSFQNGASLSQIICLDNSASILLWQPTSYPEFLQGIQVTF